jgi:hypothetical protein
MTSHLVTLMVDLSLVAITFNTPPAIQTMMMPKTKKTKRTRTRRTSLRLSENPTKTNRAAGIQLSQSGGKEAGTVQVQPVTGAP